MNKYIVTHEGPFDLTSAEDTGTPRRYSNAYIVGVRYSHRTLAAFTTMYEEAKKDFPDITPEDVHCGIVAHSGWAKNMPFIRFAVTADVSRLGWSSRDELPELIA